MMRPERMGEDVPVRVGAQRDAPSAGPFGQWLEAELARRGWTQSDLARRMGKRPGQVSAWVRGERQPSRGTLVLLSEAMNADYKALTALVERRVIGGQQWHGIPQPISVPIVRRVSGSVEEILATRTGWVAAVPHRRLTPTERWFAVEIEDEALLPDYPPGRIAVYDPQGRQVPGEYAVIEIDGRPAVRRLALEGGEWVLTDNRGGRLPVAAHAIYGMVTQFVERRESV